MFSCFSVGLLQLLYGNTSTGIFWLREPSQESINFCLLNTCTYMNIARNHQFRFLVVFGYILNTRMLLLSLFTKICRPFECLIMYQKTNLNIPFSILFTERPCSLRGYMCRKGLCIFISMQRSLTPSSLLCSLFQCWLDQ